MDVINDDRYQPMPSLSDEEFAALKADIARRGVLVPIEIDENGCVLDGHHRLRACKELGVTDFPTVIREGLSEDEKILHAYRLNTARRHLDHDQMLTLVADVLRRFPAKSNREIANLLGISHPTVGKYRKQLEALGQVVTVTTHEGADGKSYPSERSRASRQKGVPSDHPFLRWQCCICRESFPVKQDGAGNVTHDGMCNPWPLARTGYCCDYCDETLVLPARIALEITEEEKGEEARRSLEKMLLSTDEVEDFAIIGGVRDYQFPRSLAVDEAIDRFVDNDDAHRLAEMCTHWREKLSVVKSMHEDGWRFPLAVKGTAWREEYDAWSKEYSRRLREVGVTDILH